MTLSAMALIAITAQAQWTLQNSNSTASLRGIHSLGGGIAWASGTDGTVLRTEDGGYLWQTCTIPPGAEKLDFRGIQAFDANTAIVMSSGKGNLSRLYKTTDGCQSWKLIFTNPDKDGFWDAIKMTDRTIGILIGDPISDGEQFAHFRLQKRVPVFPTYHTVDGGITWKRNDHGQLTALAGPDGAPAESIFAASNSSLQIGPYVLLFITGGQKSNLHYLQLTKEPLPPFCKEPCSLASETGSALPGSESAGGFSLAANFDSWQSQVAPESQRLVIVGGDYKASEAATGTAALCSLKMEGIIMHYSCESAITFPHGYRSAVAYDAATKTWITVGPNGTDISTDDGKNWRVVKPNASLNEPADADKNWNALSLPFVVGPHGRIGKLNEPALKAALTTK